MRTNRPQYRRVPALVMRLVPLWLLTLSASNFFGIGESHVLPWCTRHTLMPAKLPTGRGTRRSDAGWNVKGYLGRTWMFWSTRCLRCQGRTYMPVRRPVGQLAAVHTIQRRGGPVLARSPCKITGPPRQTSPSHHDRGPCDQPQYGTTGGGSAQGHWIQVPAGPVCILAVVPRMELANHD